MASPSLYGDIVASLQAQVTFAAIPVALADTLLSVPETEYVYVSNGRDGVYHVWTIVDSPPEHVFDAIYNQEKLIAQRFTLLEFDFHVIAREGRELRSFITLSCQGWRKQG
jgi:hypothetical protein